jgi:hypothetical protein
MSEEPGRYGHTTAPLTSSPGEVVGTPPIQSAMRKKAGDRQGTGHVSVLEPPSAGEHRGSTDGDHEHPHGFSEKLHGLRHRSNKKTQSGNSEAGSHAGRPTPQRSLSGGPRGFLQRIATVRSPDNVNATSAESTLTLDLASQGLSEPRPKSTHVLKDNLTK